MRKQQDGRGVEKVILLAFRVKQATRKLRLSGDQGKTRKGSSRGEALVVLCRNKPLYQPRGPADNRAGSPPGGRTAQRTRNVKKRKKATASDLKSNLFRAAPRGGGI